MSEANPVDPASDLGFGSVVARDSRQRLLNRDGTFNVRRTGVGFWQSQSLYYFLLTITWPRFLAFVGIAYVSTNALFALVYYSLGREALTGTEHLEGVPRSVKEFFFSVHTLATIGYGNVSPNSLGADLVVTFESLIGLLGFSVLTGLVFSRFSRPVASILFSRHAIIAPFRGGQAFMFRIVNRRSSQVVDLEAKVLLSRRKDGEREGRQFVQLTLERDRVVFFPLSWTIVHPIDENSPLHGISAEELASSEAEFLILLNGFDETFSQVVHARSSYLGTEVVCGARFASMFNPTDEDGAMSVDIRRLDDLQVL
jgi:inward rectifier potassium channel